MVRETVFQGGSGSGDEPPRRPPGGSPPGGPPPGSPPPGQPFNPDDDQFDEALRPKHLEQVIGQAKVVERIQVMLDATRKRGDTLGHLLLDGPPGIGKTTLATVIPRELGVELQIAAGPALSAPKDLLPYLTNASPGSVLFIDEIHRLPAAVEEFLYPAMEDFRIDIALGDGLNARTINMQLKPFTVIGATTRAGMLTAPMRDRFVYREHLDFYEVEDLVEIIRRNAVKLRTTITDTAAFEIARRSQGTPRKANNLLLRTRDVATLRDDKGEITTEVAAEALEMLEIDTFGLERQDRRYLETLMDIFGGGPAGLQAIAHSMSVPPDTLEDDIEPFLLRSGLIQRTPRGRVATDAAYRHVGRTPPRTPGNADDSDDEPPQKKLF
ncbi:Holliday junction ATP-dependent DNA helicase RuvB [Maioricimonas rarisocia]|uniref:Holliday junction branch migration complex subunit RuvB n=1 Tax=Maioricimonas rarisocia TaxID=2528026 RepID=A0A517Z2I2_9PLAN|nr:Holliday junction branch migration DNA helicase RuvB [Maioricimonas rarisocia]QDU36675.1 Holliday junction ATP-dependent DNA helicase RuvB [Maioricimonas rarisocia]